MTLHVHRAAQDPSVPALVLLHGFPVDHRMWDAVAGLLPGEGAVVAVDLVGAGGRSADPLPEPSLDAAADRVVAELAAAGIGDVVVAGLSMGGYVALALLERHPARVRGLALVDTKATADAPDARAGRLRTAEALETSGGTEPVHALVGSVLGETTLATRPEVAAAVLAWIGDQDPAGLAWAQRAMAARPDRTDVLHRFTGPVAVVVGDEDRVTGADAAEHLRAAARDARLTVVPRAGHLSAVEQPDDVAEALAELVGRAGAATSGARDV